MSRIQEYRAKVSGTTPREVARLAFRKLIYRKVEMLRFEVRAADHALPAGTDLRVELLGPDRFDEILGTNPYLEAADLVDFRRQRSTCIVAYDGDRIAASTWMTSGSVHVHELHRHLDVPSTEHFSCRSYVAPGHRGRKLLDELLSSYACHQDPADTIWGLVYRWNVASYRSLERVGWRETGCAWTRFILGRRVSGERRYPPRPARDPVAS